MSAVDVAQLAGGVVALLALADGGRGWFRRTIGRRRDRYRRLRRLGTGARLTFFESVLGEPPAISRKHQLLVERYDADRTVTARETFNTHFFIEPDHYVQAITDEDDTVVSFSVSARSTTFRPTFTAPIPMRLSDRVRNWRLHRVWPRPLLRVKLNRTRFADAIPGDKRGDSGNIEELDSVPIHASIGARTGAYSEAHYFGNPGHYQTFVLSANTSAPSHKTDFESLHDVARAVGEGFDDGSASRSSPGRRFRRRSVVTTYSVVAGPPDIDDHAKYLGFGPHGDEVRTLP